MTSWSSTNASSDAGATVAGGPASPPGKRQRRSRLTRSHLLPKVQDVGLGLCIATAASAPLLAGGVHRGPLVALMVAACAGIALFAFGLIRKGRPLRLGWSVLLGVALVAIPALQSIPLPSVIRAVLDPKGTALLVANSQVAGMWPLSLDPPSTRSYIGKAALGLIVFMVGFHLASGQRRRHLMLRVLAATGVAAVAIGIGHRLFAVTKLYGILNSSTRTLLIGPFVNPNHTAELLELAAFVCLACSFQRPTVLNRIGWLVGTVLCVGAAAATLSRGAVAALGAAVIMFTLLRYFSTEERAVGRRRASLAWGGFLLAMVVFGAAMIGAGQLVDRFQASSVTSDIRFKLWHDSWQVLSSHPFGIGRGSFDRVFPIYRTLKTPFPLRFAFVENEPLQFLIDCGWLFTGLLTTAAGVIVWQLVRRGRRDKVEAALVAGLFAVMVHNLVDFGLETSGILLPFMAVLGTVVGRTTAADRLLPPRAGWLAVGFAGVAAIVGIASISHATADDFDSLLKKARDPQGQLAILERARAAHPTDYFYALAYAQLQPLAAGPGMPSPRFRALNHALALCASCESVHVEVARNLWTLGRRRQALLEWRSALEIQPKLFTPTLSELFGKGAKPEELASIATFDPARMVEVAGFLNSVGRLPQAFAALAQAEAMGAAPDETMLMRARLQVQDGKPAAAQATLALARNKGFQDPRMSILEAQVVVAIDDGVAGADRALEILDAAAVRYPNDVSIQRLRIDLVSQHAKWGAVPRALEGYKRALYARDGSATDAHIAAARIFAKLYRWTDAVGEYRIALADQPLNVPLWMELGGTAELSGRITVARDAYAQAARLSPSDPAIVNAIKMLDERRRQLSQPSLDNSDPAAPR